MIVTLWVLQNDLVHGWGLDFALRKCVEASRFLITLIYLISIYWIFSICSWTLTKVPSLCRVAGLWEDRSCWYSVDYSSKYSLARESGNLFSMIIIPVGLYNLYSLQNQDSYLFFSGFGRENQNLGRRHGKGYVAHFHIVRLDILDSLVY